MSSKDKRADFRRPDIAGARGTKASLPGPAVPAQPRRKSGGAWWPLAAAAGLTFVLVVLVVLANLDSPPIPSAP